MWSMLTTGSVPRRFLPARKSSSMAKAYPAIFAPVSATRRPVAAARGRLLRRRGARPAGRYPRRCQGKNPTRQAPRAPVSPRTETLHDAADTRVDAQKKEAPISP